MADLGQSIRYGSEGFAIGNEIAPGVGGVIGGAIGVIGGLSTNSAENEREKRMRELTESYNFAMNQNQQRIVKERSGALGTVRQGVAHQLAARGVSGGNESQYLLPAEQGVLDTTQKSLDANRKYYEDAILNAKSDFADRPIEPNTMDYAVEAGTGFAQNQMQNRYLDAYSSAYSPNQNWNKQYPSTVQVNNPIKYQPWQPQ